jgi:(p)ppGpp synthase/HD superfamily hydrolase
MNVGVGINILKKKIMNNFTLDLKAHNFAQHHHRGQKRDDGRDYFIHLNNVKMLLKKVGARQEVQIAGLLHDILEDTKVTEGLLTLKFGKEICSLVKQVTKPFNITSNEGWLIKLCDIVDNCTDMTTWSERRIRKYLKNKRLLLDLI